MIRIVNSYSSAICTNWYVNRTSAIHLSTFDEVLNRRRRRRSENKFNSSRHKYPEKAHLSVIRSLRAIKINGNSHVYRHRLHLRAEKLDAQRPIILWTSLWIRCHTFLISQMRGTRSTAWTLPRSRSTSIWLRRRHHRLPQRCCRVCCWPTSPSTIQRAPLRRFRRSPKFHHRIRRRRRRRRQSSRHSTTTTTMMAPRSR